MTYPSSSRPHMPGYGVVDASEGGGLLPWSWAEEQLVGSHDYWVTTTWPGRGPHIMPVWGVWDRGAMWFSSSLRSRKVRNLERSPRCSITTENAKEPVILEGVARVVTDRSAIAGFAEAMNRKYETDYPDDFYDPEVNATVEMRPSWAMGMIEANFTGSPTRWTFPES